jgi:dTDP-L-rhamnose 4-epimerase
MIRALVTGGAGFIGSTLVDLLVDRGYEVISADVILPTAHDREPEYLNPKAEHRFGDLRDEEFTSSIVKGVDAVFHQASMVGLGAGFEDAPDYVANNDAATAELLRRLYLDGFRGRFVLASSMVVYGEGCYRCPDHGLVSPPPRSKERLTAGEFEPRCPDCGADLSPEAVPEDSRLDPRNVYAATKLHQEHLCFAFGRELGVRVAALRYHNVYGPRMPKNSPYSGVAAIFRGALERGEAPRVFEDGAQIRDFVHVTDVARANLLAFESDEVGAFNIASGDPRTVGDMARALSASFGATEPLVTGEFRLGDVRHVFASVERAAVRLGFRAQIRFENGMDDFTRAPLR